MAGRASWRDWVKLHLVVVAWGFTAILGKLVSLPAVELTVWRTALAAVGLAGIMAFRRRRPELDPGAAWAFFGTGALIGGHWMLFFLSARLGSASVTLAAMPTVLVWSSLIEPWVDGTRRWRAGELLVGAVMVGAVWLIYRVEFSQWMGFTVGLVSAFLAAVFAVWNKGLVAKHDPTVITGFQMLAACAVCVAAMPWSGAGWSWPSKADWLWLLLLSQVCTVGAYVAYLQVLRRLSVFTVNVVYNLEPVYGILLAALVFGETERMSPGFYLGAAIIVLGVTALPWIRGKPEEEPATGATGP
jgi:drug/metabolite transporter (DMT)-like permease